MLFWNLREVKSMFLGFKKAIDRKKIDRDITVRKPIKRKDSDGTGRSVRGTWSEVFECTVCRANICSLDVDLLWLRPHTHFAGSLDANAFPIFPFLSPRPPSSVLSQCVVFSFSFTKQEDTTPFPFT